MPIKYNYIQLVFSWYLAGISPLYSIGDFIDREGRLYYTYTIPYYTCATPIRVLYLLKAKDGPQKRHLHVEWHMQCISYRPVSEPNVPINRILIFVCIFCLSKTGLRPPSVQTTEQVRPLWGHFDALCGWIGATLEHCGATLV